jgi:hypothetical protein
MKALAAIIALIFPLSVLGNDLRLVGTNLYDFTHAGPAFHVRGFVAHYYARSTEILVASGRYKIAPPVDPLTDDRSARILEGRDFDEFMGVYHLTRNGVITEQQFRNLDYAHQRHFTPIFSSVFLLNYPTPGSPAPTEKIDSKVRHATEVDCIAVATSAKGYYDCGSPFHGDTNQFALTYVITQNRIVIRTNSGALQSQLTVSDR